MTESGGRKVKDGLLISRVHFSSFTCMKSPPNLQVLALPRSFRKGKEPPSPLRSSTLPTHWELCSLRASHAALPPPQSPSVSGRTSLRLRRTALLHRTTPPETPTRRNPLRGLYLHLHNTAERIRESALPLLPTGSRADPPIHAHRGAPSPLWLRQVGRRELGQSTAVRITRGREWGRIVGVAGRRWRCRGGGTLE